MHEKNVLALADEISSGLSIFPVLPPPSGSAGPPLKNRRELNSSLIDITINPVARQVVEEMFYLP
jgi:hypothetical protein